TIGGLLVLLGLYAKFRNMEIARENLRVAEEGKLTERFSKAVELLGSDKLDIRLGGIYALERIARDSLKDHWTVMEVLTAFVREQSRAEREKLKRETENIQKPENSNSDKSEIIRLREDIQAALTVIDRRKWIEEERPHQRINLNNSFLKRANLSGANLRGAVLSRTNLTEASLVSTDLTEASLGDVKLNNAYLKGTKLIKADLTGADLSNV